MSLQQHRKLYINIAFKVTLCHFRRSFEISIDILMQDNLFVILLFRTFILYILTCDFLVPSRQRPSYFHNIMADASNATNFVFELCAPLQKKMLATAIIPDHRALKPISKCYKLLEFNACPCNLSFISRASPFKFQFTSYDTTWLLRMSKLFSFSSGCL